MNEIFEVMRDRRSIRSFTGEPVTMEQMEKLKECALYSPTAMNRRTWHFSFVTDKELLSSVEQGMVELIYGGENETAKERMKGRNDKVFYGAPLVVFLHIDPLHPWADVDCGIAVQNLALGAQALGLGSCIIGMIKPLMNGDQGTELRRKMGVPENYVFSIAIAIGATDINPQRPVADNEPVTFI